MHTLNPTDVSGSPLAYSIPDALRVLPIGRTKLYELLDAGTIRSLHVGRRRLVIASSLREFCEGGDPGGEAA